MSLGIIFINSALILYSVGVWSEKLQGKLKPWHLVVFWIGIFCDIAGTSAMGAISKHDEASVSFDLFQYMPTYFEFHFHSIAGAIALALMMMHAGWATFVVMNRNDDWLKRFHRYSLIVWIIWLVPFVSGAIIHFFR